MSGGYGTHVSQIERHEKQSDGTYAMVETWWEAGSPRGKLTTVCGHKHATEDGARECMAWVEKTYIAKRWPKLKVR